MPLPTASVVICTRNRGDRIVPAIESILRNDHTHFELLVVDQSSDNKTEIAVASYLTDRRLTYLRTDTVGTSRGQNLAIARSRGQLIAITDDDCTVPVDWLRCLERLFIQHPTVALIYCDIVSGEHDASQGFVPAIAFDRELTLRKLGDYRRHLGIGAGMALRRDLLTDLGGFDESLGPGAQFRSGADQDLGIRALIKRRHVLLTNATSVTHHGFRTWDDGRELISRYFFGAGAFCVKPLKCGHFGILYHILYRVLIDLSRRPMAKIFRFQKRAKGFRRLFAFFQGFLAGSRARVDPVTLRYVEK